MRSISIRDNVCGVNTIDRNVSVFANGIKNRPSWSSISTHFRAQNYTNKSPNSLFSRDFWIDLNKRQEFRILLEAAAILPYSSISYCSIRWWEQQKLFIWSAPWRNLLNISYSHRSKPKRRHSSSIKWEQTPAARGSMARKRPCRNLKGRTVRTRRINSESHFVSPFCFGQWFRNSMSYHLRCQLLRQSQGVRSMNTQDIADGLTTGYEWGCAVLDSIG